MVDVQQSGSPRESSPHINEGLGRVLIWVYGVLAFAAIGRSSFQIATKFHAAPLAYVLSAMAAVIYLVATICLARSTPGSRLLAIICTSIELVGVIAVGTASLVWSGSFKDTTVWSDFGVGYGYVPLILPMVGLWWLLRGAERAKARTD